MVLFSSKTKKRLFLGFNLLGVGLVIERKLLTFRRVRSDDFEPLIARGSWLVVWREAAENQFPFFVAYSPNERSGLLGYQIAGPGQWIENKKNKYHMKISENNVAYDTFQQNSGKIICQSFIEGRPVAAINPSLFGNSSAPFFQRLDRQSTNPGIDVSRFSIGLVSEAD
jgi:signal peptidase I